MMSCTKRQYLYAQKLKISSENWREKVISLFWRCSPHCNTFVTIFSKLLGSKLTRHHPHITRKGKTGRSIYDFLFDYALTNRAKYFTWYVFHCTFTSACRSLYFAFRFTSFLILVFPTFSVFKSPQSLWYKRRWVTFLVFLYVVFLSSSNWIL